MDGHQRFAERYPNDRQMQIYQQCLNWIQLSKVENSFFKLLNIFSVQDVDQLNHDRIQAMHHLLPICERLNWPKARFVRSLLAMHQDF